MARSLDKDPLYQQLLFSLPMREGTGTAVTADVAKPHHPVTLTHAPAWVQVGPMNTWVMDFDGNNDYLTCAAADSADLNFTTGDFSGLAWVYADGFGAANNIITKGEVSVCGFTFDIQSGATLRLMTSAPALQGSMAQAVPTAGWLLYGFTRSGTSVRLMVNGADMTTIAPSHSNLASSAAYPLDIAAYSAIHGYKWNGKVWNPRIWGRALKPEEHRQIFDRERALFGV
jgi:hypothetical protein